jgi:hypothetical protein
MIKEKVEERVMYQESTKESFWDRNFFSDVSSGTDEYTLPAIAVGMQQDYEENPDSYPDADDPYEDWYEEVLDIRE